MTVMTPRDLSSYLHGLSHTERVTTIEGALLCVETLFLMFFRFPPFRVHDLQQLPFSKKVGSDGTQLAFLVNFSIENPVRRDEQTSRAMTAYSYLGWFQDLSQAKTNVELQKMGHDEAIARTEILMTWSKDKS